MLGMLVLVAMIGLAKADCVATSGRASAALVELYTSEGCDSCPPADRWLRSLVASERIVPLALHVDYWDYIGWKDPFARPEFTARQRERSRRARETVVYTPQVVIAGRDFRGWSSARAFETEVKRVNAAPAKADLRLSITAGETSALRAEATLTVQSEHADKALYVALVENGLSSRVRAGENRGRTLEHDHVARQWWGPVAFAAAGRAVLARAVQLVPGAAGRSGAVAFVEDRASGAIMQALALAPRAGSK